jgi:hypothetical protein
MTRQSRSWRVRLAFEPNRFSAEQLERVYEQLKPTGARTTSAPSISQPAATKRANTKRGER